MISQKILRFMIIIGIMFLDSRLTASALGHPDNDIIVRNLRETFKAGIVVPDASSLEGVVDCYWFQAFGDERNAYPIYEYKFAEDIPGGGWFTLMKGQHFLGGYVLDSDGLRMTGHAGRPGEFYTEYVRLDAATGNLIFEGSTLDGSDGRLESIAEPGLFVESYMICYKRK